MARARWHPRRSFRHALVGVLTTVLVWAGVATDGHADRREQGIKSGLAFFAGATRLADAEGDPPAFGVYASSSLVGYLFSTDDVVGSTGYSGKPLDVLVGIDLSGVITGAALIAHQEPILVIGVGDRDLEAFVGQFAGHDIRQTFALSGARVLDGRRIDGVSGATISSQVIADAVLRAARAVAARHGILGVGADLDFESYQAASWSELLAGGSLVGRRLSVGEVTEAFWLSGGDPFAPGVPRPEDDAAFLDLYAGLATPAFVGRNLLGELEYNRVMAGLEPGDQLLFVGGSGIYSFKGTRYRRSGVFDRVRLRQVGQTVRLTSDRHIGLESIVAADAPSLREAALFVIPAASGFDPRRPWYLDLAVDGRDPDGVAVRRSFEVAYQLPERYRRAATADASSEPLWMRNWYDRQVEIAVLGLGLLVLSTILVFQNSIARRPRTYDVIRVGILVFTLVWVGLIAGAQLSVLNVLTFGDAIIADFRWDFFLVEPLIFILWAYVAVVLLFWGRGVFCGWLCPFGALQELLNRLARLAKLPQWRVPFGLHERLWPVKYVVFLALFATFLQDPVLTIAGAEIEPFKTAIVLAFNRSWPFLVYVALLLIAGLFVNRAFCRYLCPLGAALAVPARIRMFDWLKRRWQCGTSCQQCAHTCPVQAIHPDGKINPNECIHCLHCQAYYFDDTVCPPLIERRKRREARAAQRAEREAAATDTTLT